MNIRNLPSPTAEWKLTSQALPTVSELFQHSLSLLVRTEKSTFTPAQRIAFIRASIDLRWQVFDLLQKYSWDSHMHSVRADKQNSQLMFSWGLRVLMAIYILITIYTILRMRPCQLWQHFLRVKETIWKWLWLFLSKSLSKKSNHMWVFLSNCPFTWLQREASQTGHREHLNCTRIFRHPQSSGCVEQQCVLLQYGGGKKKKKVSGTKTAKIVHYSIH